MLTVKDVVEMKMMKEARVRTAKDCLSLRRVNWVSVIEVPVDNFIRENELVLSSAISCGHNPSQFYRFVHDVIRSGASALGVATGYYLTDIPDKVLQLAESNKLPLIEIPWELRFSDIVQQVANKLNQKQNQMVQLSKDVQGHLLQLLLQGTNLSEIAATAEKYWGQPSIIVDENGEILGQSPRSKSFSQLQTKHSKQKKSTFIYQLSAHRNPIHSEWRWFQMDQYTCLEMPIRSSRKLRGYLLSLLPEGINPEEFAKSENLIILEHVATTAALWFLQHQAVRETELRFQHDFVWSLAKGEFHSQEVVQSRARTLGLDINRSYVCLAGRLEERPQRPEPEVPDLLQTRLERKIRMIGHRMDRRLLVASQGGEWVIFLESIPEQAIEVAHEFLDRLEGSFLPDAPDWYLSWGIAENRTGVFTFETGYQDARTALEIGRKQKGIGYRSFFKETGLYRALRHLGNHPEMQEITWKTMENLFDYSRKRGIDLIQTLKVYIRHQCNVSQTARELNLHRQSLLYRLRKIEFLTGLTFLNPDDLFLLHLSLKIWENEINERE
ncbi:PucR family transcriptional regulator [Melghirimyces algeriensis]|uniref:Purine catabolism regulatory protein n=1 Tax=Melghirimyces algeriensis TaxID=910412 RepID=A0A521CV22_9BACL|nr:PucR family transcriptional regulator [Melghirimyces algeriensis]SMO63314.1 purine catabolism regulatory protein [Melghirimyces algeriensis]